MRNFRAQLTDLVTAGDDPAVPDPCPSVQRSSRQNPSLTAGLIQPSPVGQPRPYPAPISELYLQDPFASRAGSSTNPLVAPSRSPARSSRRPIFPTPMP